MKRTDTRKLTTLAIFTALIVVLQLISALLTRFVPVLPVSITLTLVPIVVGAALYGVGAGAYLGGVMGAVVLLFCVISLDLGGAVLWNSSPLLCALVCLVKGIAAGAVAALAYRALSGKNATAAAVVAGICAPTVNTALFVAGMFLFFKDTLLAWTEGWAAQTGNAADPLFYAILGLAGINYLLELTVNLVLAPVIVRIIKARRPFAFPVRVVEDNTKNAQ